VAAGRTFDVDGMAVLVAGGGCGHAGFPHKRIRDFCGRLGHDAWLLFRRDDYQMKLT
jgi:hypothetical protein